MGETPGAYNEGSGVAKLENKTEKGSVKGLYCKIPTVCGDGEGAKPKTVKVPLYIPVEFAPIYVNELAILRQLAVIKLWILRQYVSKDGTLDDDKLVTSCDRQFFTKYEFVELYHNLNEILTVESIYPDYRKIQQSPIKTLDLICPRKIHAAISQKIGEAKHKLGESTKGSKNWKHIENVKDKLNSITTLCESIKVDKGQKTIGELFKVVDTICINLGDQELLNTLKAYPFGGYSYYTKLAVLERKLDNVVATHFDTKEHPGRGSRLLTLWGVPGDPPTRGDLVGLPFGFAYVVRPKRVRDGWYDAPLNSNAVMTVKCYCGKGEPTKVTWFDLKRGRCFSCGCLGQKNFTDKWLESKQQVAHARYVKKSCDTSDHDFRFFGESSFVTFAGLPWLNKGLDVSRLDDFGDYEPGLCFWESESDNRKRGAETRKRLREEAKAATVSLPVKVTGRGPTLRKNTKEKQEVAIHFDEKQQLPENDESDVDFEL